MPEQFQYPDQGMWGTTQLKGKGYPELSKEDWQKWLDMKPSSGKFYANKNASLDEFMKRTPEGFMAESGHPGLDNIKEDADIYSIPNRDDAVFVKPKAVPTS